MKADPAAVVGMCTSMHAEFKKATLYNEELRSLPEFMKSMKSQYLTSLGLGKPFPKDSNNRPKRKARNARSRNNSRGNAYGYLRLGGSRRQQVAYYSPQAAIPQPYAGTNAGGNAISGREQQARATQGRNICYHYRECNSRRGTSCRFLYLNNNCVT